MLLFGKENKEEISCYINLFVIALSWYARCDWSNLQAVFHCTARLGHKLTERTRSVSYLNSVRGIYLLLLFLINRSLVIYLQQLKQLCQLKTEKYCENIRRVKRANTINT